MSQPSEKADRYYDRADMLYRQAYFDSALLNVNKYLQRKGDPEGFYLRAMIQEAKGKDMRALDDYSTAIQYDPSYSEAYFKRAEIFLKNGIYNEAIKNLDHLIASGDTDTRGVFFMQDIHQQDQIKVVTLSGIKNKLLSMRGTARQAIGKYEEALDDFNQAIALDSSAQNLVNRALLFEETNRKNLAIRDLNTALKLNPDLVIAWFNLVRIDPSTQVPSRVVEDMEFGPMLAVGALEAYEKRDYKLSYSLYSRALKNTPNDAVLLLNAGRLDMKMDRGYDARKKFNRVLEIEPGRLETYYLIANSFFNETKFEEAAAYYEQFLIRDASNGQIWYNAAMAYFELENNAEACRCLRMAAGRGMNRAKPYITRRCQQE
ncbi:MAG: tetratricopeptide repeat protein [Cyclobacteriaceae bacterium]|nr:tetratricopeptide repeat protein [Cyclobacteriaceae bacterium HetDA_MAG_MS6]